MSYPIALFAILFFDFAVIMLQIRYAIRHSSQARKVMFPDTIYSGMQSNVSDTKFTGEYQKMKIVKIVHHEQQCA
jgi:hypothetical protein